MSRKPKAYVLDSWAVLAYLEDESSGQKVADLIGDAHEHGIPLLMSVVNAGEVWYILAREVSEAEADKGSKWTSAARESNFLIQTGNSLALQECLKQNIGCHLLTVLQQR